MDRQKIYDDFLTLYQKNRIWENSSWLGVPVWKLHSDLFIFQEIIFKLRPDYIIETGTCLGGSALFYASILELIGHGQVVTIDKEDRIDKKIFLDPAITKLFQRVISLIGDSSDEYNYKKIQDIVAGKKNIVFLDSWHSKDHVLKELKLYSKLVPLGSYIIVEDTLMNGHPVEWEWGEGPYEAVQEFLKGNDTFAVDKTWEKLLITSNPCGYLKKVFHER